ncbi:MAG: response regulator [Polyangiaceae bacterium]|nr:response regulator [Polyangiaceae bacterium]
MGLEAKNAAWDVEREIEREDRKTSSSPANSPRADFLANLGRRASELTAMLTALEREPASARLRDDLRRRLHALGAGARLLRFDRLAAEVVSGEDLLHEVAERGALTASDAAALRASFGTFSSLGFAPNDAGPAAASPAALAPTRIASQPAAEVRSWPMSVLVVGPKPLADALMEPVADGGASIEVERTDDGLRAIDLARAVAPDVIVVDADMRGTRELVAAFRADPLTSAVGIVVLGSWARGDEATAYLGAGATRCVHKPISPDALRRVCRDASAEGASIEAAHPLGDLSVAELAARLGREVERAIQDGVKAGTDNARVDLGRGDDVMSAMLTAAARVRDLVTIRSRGEIRFAPGAAERAAPVGAWMNESNTPTDAKAPRRNGVQASAASARALSGARVLVADDDPAVAWFLAGVLRAEGAVVSEACDGATALRKAMEQHPDVVLTDVLMPNVDGLTLAETLRNDPISADCAIALLSWKDDLLQRSRELGARADVYLRKDASGPTVVERTREMMFSRARLAERLAAGGEMLGRVDGFTMCTLLKLVCTHRPASRIEVRDAAYLYDVTIDGGQPVSATRVSKDGRYVRGAAVMQQLLGVRAGRFMVAAAPAEAPERDLDSSLAEHIAAFAAPARAVTKLLLGPSFQAVSRIDFDADWLAAYGTLAPEPVRAALRRLASGEAPRKVASASPSALRLFEEVVRDAALRGGVVRVIGADNEDLLVNAITVEQAILRGDKNASMSTQATDESIPIEEVSPSGVIVAPVGVVNAAVAPAASLTARAAADHLAARGEDGTAAPGAVSDGSELFVGEAAPGAAEPRPAQPSLPATLGSLTPPPSAPRIEPEPLREAPVIKLPKRAAAVVIEEEEESPAPRRSKKKERVETTPAAPGVKASNPRIGVWVMCAVAGIVFAVGARISQDRRATPAEPPPAAAQPAPAASTTAEAAATQVAAAPTSAPTTPSKVITVPGEMADDPILPQEAPLRSDEKLPKGQGLLEVVVGPNDQVSIDGQPTVAGPVVKATLAPRATPYEIKVKMQGEERTRFASIREGRRTRVRIAPPWNR